jgi:hypothetical protein
MILNTAIGRKKIFIDLLLEGQRIRYTNIVLITNNGYRQIKILDLAIVINFEI